MPIKIRTGATSVKVVGLCIAALILLGGTYVLGRYFQPASDSTDGVQNKTGTTAESVLSNFPRFTSDQRQQDPPIPQESGRTYHAMDLMLINPFPNQGMIVTLDVRAMAESAYGDFRYVTVPGFVPSEAHARGLEFSQMLGEGTCIFDIIAQIPGGGRSTPDSAGKIAVEVPSGMGPPSPNRNWKVIPDGTEEVTSNDGTVMRLPKIQFLRYEDAN